MMKRGKMILGQLFFCAALLAAGFLPMVPSCWATASLDSVLIERMSQMPPDDVVPVIVRIQRPHRQPLPETMALRERRRKVVQNLRAESALQQKPVRSLLDRWQRPYRDLWIINGLALRLTGAEIRALAEQPGVLEVSYDAPMKLAVTSVRPVAVSSPWPLIMIKADQLPNLSGQGVVVASLDTGVDLTHSEFAVGSWRGGAGDWFNPFAENPANCPGGVCSTCESELNQPCDGDSVGHGTGVMSLMVGSTLGVAPGARWIAGKIFDDLGNSSNSIIHLALQWALDPDNDPATNDAPDIVNGSWGFESVPDQCLTEFQADIQNLKNAGIAISFSAGNTGPLSSSSVSPANNSNNFGVGYVDGLMAISQMSARGPSRCDAPGQVFPELVAPGEGVTIAQPGNGFALADGSSFSAPHVSGVMALLLEDFPNTDPATMEAALTTTARDLGVGGPDNSYGNGLVDALAAHGALLAPVPVLQTPANAELDQPGDLTLVWSQPADSFAAAVTNSVWLGTDPGFTGVSPVQVAMNEPVWPRISSHGLFLISILFPPGLFFARRRLALICGLLLCLAFLLVSCGGGGGGSSAGPDSTLRQLDVSGLTPATTYYWKVQSKTNRGAPVSESGVFSFTTQ